MRTRGWMHPKLHDLRRKRWRNVVFAGTPGWVAGGWVGVLSAREPPNQMLLNAVHKGVRHSTQAQKSLRSRFPRAWNGSRVASRCNTPIPHPPQPRSASAIGPIEDRRPTGQGTGTSMPGVRRRIVQCPETKTSTRSNPGPRPQLAPSKTDGRQATGRTRTTVCPSRRFRPYRRQPGNPGSGAG